MKTEAIKSFLRNHYSDEKLAALLAHAQDGKLVYDSCCCFIGTATSNHALRTEDCPEFFQEFRIFGVSAGRAPTGHYARALMLIGAADAEEEFLELGDSQDGTVIDSDHLRRKVIKRLIRTEMKRRARQAVKAAEAVRATVPAETVVVGRDPQHSQTDRQLRNK